LKNEFERHAKVKVSKRTILRLRHYLEFVPAPVVPKLVLNEAQRNVRLSNAKMLMDEPNFDCWWFSDESFLKFGGKAYARRTTIFLS
jgi:hypothetical protein